MLSTIIFILKILFIIFIVLLGLIVILLSIILFVPINYKIIGEKDEIFVLNAKANWLFNAIKFNCSYDNGIELYLKVFWKTILSTESKKEFSQEKVTNHKALETLNRKDDINIDGVKEEKDDICRNEINVDKITDNNINKNNIYKDYKKKKINNKKNKSYKNKKRKDSEEREDKFNFLKLKDILKDDVYKGVLKFIFSQFNKIIRKMLPKKAKIKLEFGTGDPAVTGYILGALSILYAFSGNSMVIEPDFNNKVLKGEFDLKGRIYIFIILYYALKIILDKRVRKIISEYNI